MAVVRQVIAQVPGDLTAIVEWDDTDGHRRCLAIEVTCVNAWLITATAPGGKSFTQRVDPPGLRRTLNVPARWALDGSDGDWSISVCRA